MYIVLCIVYILCIISDRLCSLAYYNVLSVYSNQSYHVSKQDLTTSKSAHGLVVRHSITSFSFFFLCYQEGFFFCNCHGLVVSSITWFFFISMYNRRADFWDLPHHWSLRSLKNDGLFNLSFSSTTSALFFLRNLAMSSYYIVCFPLLFVPLRHCLLKKSGLQGSDSFFFPVYSTAFAEVWFAALLLARGVLISKEAYTLCKEPHIMGHILSKEPSIVW